MTSSDRSQPKGKFDRQAKWREKNPLKRWAHIATAAALRRGLLVKQPCSVCGSQDSEAHHPDHRDPLSVEWLCRVHHKERHRLGKQEASNG